MSTIAYHRRSVLLEATGAAKGLGAKCDRHHQITICTLICRQRVSLLTQIGLSSSDNGMSGIPAQKERVCFKQAHVCLLYTSSVYRLQMQARSLYASFCPQDPRFSNDCPVQPAKFQSLQLEFGCFCSFQLPDASGDYTRINPALDEHRCV